MAGAGAGAGAQTLGRLLRPPETLYRRLVPPGWSLNKAEMLVLPSPRRFYPHPEDGLISVGVHSIIIEHGKTPEEAMLWGDRIDYPLVKLELADVETLGLTVHLDPKPMPPDGEGPWHANIHGVPGDTKANKATRKKIADKLAEHSQWVTDHRILMDLELAEWVDQLREREGLTPAASAKHEWTIFLGKVQPLNTPRKMEFVATARDAIARLSP